jgi:DinB superfamily
MHMRIAQVTTIEGIEDPYTARILSYIIGKNPLKILSRTPGVLRKLTKGLGKKALNRLPADGKWSISQIVSHMRDAEVVFAYRLRMAVAQSGAGLPAFDEKEWQKNLHYGDGEFSDILRTFTSLRTDAVAFLRMLGPEELQRFGMHAERGKETVERIAQMYAGHDRNHLMQIEKIRRMKKGSKTR